MGAITLTKITKDHNHCFDFIFLGSIYVASHSKTFMTTFLIHYERCDMIRNECNQKKMFKKKSLNIITNV
jgi:hypothetical protein